MAVSGDLNWHAANSRPSIRQARKRPSVCNLLPIMRAREVCSWAINSERGECVTYSAVYVQRRLVGAVPKKQAEAWHELNKETRKPLRTTGTDERRAIIKIKGGPKLLPDVTHSPDPDGVAPPRVL